MTPTAQVWVPLPAEDKTPAVCLESLTKSSCSRTKLDMLNERAERPAMHLVVHLFHELFNVNQLARNKLAFLCTGIPN